MSRPAGLVKFFYHCPGSVLPVRDVLRGKTEPHDEAGAENFCSNCYQGFVRRIVDEGIGHLFLMTTCRHAGAGAPLGAGAKYIVGHIRATGWGLNMAGGVYVEGEMHKYSFQDAFPIVWLKNRQGANIKNGARQFCLDEAECRRVLAHFEGRRCILPECVDEIIRLDPMMRTCPHITRGTPCPRAATCPRLRQLAAALKTLA